ncbi:MAG: DUF6438 domain-containing protein [Acidobacteriota bacterium]
MPEFVLYDDGKVIFNGSKDAGAYKLFTASLSPSEVDALMTRVDAREFDSYSDSYSIGSEYTVTDLPSPFLMMRRPDGTYKRILLYGSLSEKADPKYRVQNIPLALVEAFRFLWNYQSPKAVGWRPKYFETIVSPYDGESKKSVKWNKTLPDLNDSKTVPFKRENIQHFSIFVPEALERPFALTIHKLRRSNAALTMNGKRWNLSYRFPFPSERVWLAGSDGKMFRDEK